MVAQICEADIAALQSPADKVRNSLPTEFLAKDDDQRFFSHHRFAEFVFRTIERRGQILVAVGAQA